MQFKLTGAKKRLIPLLLILVFLIAGFPQVALAANFSAIVTADSMAIYSDAALSKKIGSLSEGEVVVVGKHEGNVALILYRPNGNYGFAKVSDMATVDSVAKKAVVSVSGAKVYQKASSSSGSASVKKGLGIYVLAISGDWAKVENDGYVGYMYTSALYIDGVSSTVPSVTATPAPTIAPTTSANNSVPDGFNESVTWVRMYATANTASKVYKACSVSSNVLGTLSSGTQVKVYGYTPTWALIELDGNYGYCLLSTLTPANSPTVTPTPTVAPTTSADNSVPDGFNESVTWVRMYATVNTASKVYKACSVSSNVLGTLSSGTQVKVYGYTPTWALIELDGNYGYCLLSTLTSATAPIVTPTPTPSVPDGTNEDVVVQSFAAVANGTTIVYKSASATSKQLGSIAAGTQVNVGAYTDTWALIELNGNYGFCLRSQLMPVSEATATPTPTPTPTVAPTATPSVEEAIPAIVTASSGVIIYRGFSTSSEKIGYLVYGTELNVITASKEWAYIEYNGNYGFCKIDGLTPKDQMPSETVQPDDVVTAQFNATVIYPSTPVYASASTSSASTTLPMGTEVTVYAYNTAYAYIGKGTARGYVEKKYLSNASFTTISSGSSGDAVLTLQKLLETLGFFDGVPSSSYSSLTQAAVARFQAAAGMSATGTADVNTLRVLTGGYAPSSPILSLNLASGSSGENVQRLQTRLYYKGYLAKTSSVDGDYGSITTSAIKLFQTAAGLSVTGKADSNTIKALYSANAPKYSGTAADESSSGGDSSSGGSSQTTLPSNPTRSEKIEYLVYVAYQQLGKPYVYGATGTSSYDCSGFTTYCYKKIGVSLGRTAYTQGYSAGTKIDGLSNLTRGDIVCLNTVSDNDLSDHVGIYLGGGQFIHASSGAGKVIISSLTSGYYNNVFSWGRRVL